MAWVCGLGLGLEARPLPTNENTDHSAVTQRGAASHMVTEEVQWVWRVARLLSPCAPATEASTP